MAPTDWPNRMTVQDEMLTIREAAELSGMTEHGIRLWVINGKLPAARYRSTYVISKMILAMVVAANRQGMKETDSVEGVGIEALLTESQVAKILGLTRQRVNQLVFSGKLPSISFGPKVTRISKADLECFIANRGDGVVHAPPPIDLLTVEEAAEQLRSSSITVKNLIQKGELRAAKVGNSYRIYATSVRGYLRRQSRHPGRDITATIQMYGSSPSLQRKVKAHKTRYCSYCMNTYPDGGYAEHINDAEHIRARGLRNGSTRV